eukprot:TRINITY_DN12775_c0_g1_i3.p1 TRINITY_DN12775_c0_g1~~TRINITY_DN12775_c0_g1_i3.p1  ORF type:complete len:613 (-),score=96.58 TRINITY_DN12775_c0_g1_i3:109-1947(-)
MARKKTHSIYCRYSAGAYKVGAKGRSIHADDIDKTSSDVKALALSANDAEMHILTKQIVELVEKTRNSKLLAEIDRLREIESTLSAQNGVLETLLHDCERDLEFASTNIDELELQVQEKSREIESLTNQLKCASIARDELSARLESQLCTTTALEEQLSGLASAQKDVASSRSAEWQFDAGNNEWRSFPADCSDALLKHHENYLKTSGPAVVRIQLGAAQFDFCLETFTQKNVRTGNACSIRCSIHAPRHWTQTLTLHAVCNPCVSQAVVVSGFRRDELNTVFSFSDKHVINGFPVWWSQGHDVLMYVTNKRSLGIYIVEKSYADLRDGKKNLLLARIPQCDHPLHTGKWWQWVQKQNTWEPVVPTIVEQRRERSCSPSLIDILVDVTDADVLLKLRAVLAEGVTNDNGDDGAVMGEAWKSHLKLVRVLRIENWYLWQKYQSHVEQTKRDLLTHGIDAELGEPCLPSALEQFAATYFGSTLDTRLNESLLFHGTKYKIAVHIAEHGFDARSGDSACDGQGVCFTSQAYASHRDAKVANGLHTLVLSRVVLGDIHVADQFDERQLRPPMHVGKARCCDSVAVRPGALQSHQTFLTFDKFQAYPELIVQYAVDA